MLVLVVYGGLMVLTYQQFVNTPKGFIPSQDMGYMLINVQLPDSASDERTAQGDSQDRRNRPRHAGHHGT